MASSQDRFHTSLRAFTSLALKQRANSWLDYAPACAIINGFFTILIEIPRMTAGDILQVGLITLIANAFVAFLLNVSVVLLVCVLNRGSLVGHDCHANI